MLIARRIGGGVIAVLAVIFWITLGPEEADAKTDFKGDIAAALSEGELNAGNTDNVYQQQVVNGWTSVVHLLEVIAREGSTPAATEPDDRVVAELALVVLALALLLVTSPNVPGAAPEFASSDFFSLGHVVSSPGRRASCCCADRGTWARCGDSPENPRKGLPGHQTIPAKVFYQAVGVYRQSLTTFTASRRPFALQIRRVDLIHIPEGDDGQLLGPPDRGSLLPLRQGMTGRVPPLGDE